MTTVVLEGGLGNQLFGAALALQLAQAHGEPVIINSSRLMPLRPFALDEIPGFLDFLGERGVHPSDARLAAGRLRRRLDPLWVVESGFAFDERILHVRPGTILNGYFQSAKYFTGVRESLSRHLRNSLSKASPNLPFDSTGKVVAHVRRGDYLDHLEYHGIAELGYFRTAKKFLGDARPLVVVTDETRPDELNKIAQQLRAQHVLSPTELPRGVDVLALLSRADDLILSNSSLSWWGAILGGRNPRVVAPRPWFSAPKLDTSDLLEPGWLTLDRACTAQD